MLSSPLQQYITRLEDEGELFRIAVPVDPALEIAAITDRVCKEPGGGRALLFENPTEGCFPVVTNLFGSQKRIQAALNVAELDELTDRLSILLALIPDLAIDTLDRQIAALPEFSRFVPRDPVESVSSLVQMNPPNLAHFPFLQSWPGDGAASGHSRYITLPQIFTVDPDGATPNCGVYRVQLLSASEVAIQWKAGSGAARHAEQYSRTGKSMPVAIVLGGDPAALFSAMMPLPGDLDEMAFAGFLRGAPLDTVSCRHVPMRIPAGAEVVIEGYVEPGQVVTEGPFGNHTGFYSPAAPAALMRITAISHRRHAVIPATVVGPPPMEDCWMAQVWERLLLAFLQTLEPSIKDIRFPLEWIFHQSAVIYLENPQPDMVRNVLDRLWRLPWFASARILVFVAAGGGSGDLSHVLWRAINVTDYGEDVITDRITGRVAIDATDGRCSMERLRLPADYAYMITQRWKEYGLA